MPKRRRNSLSSGSSTECDLEKYLTKESLNEAIALIYEDESEEKKKCKELGGSRCIRKCQSPCLKALSLSSAAEIHQDNTRVEEVLEVLRICLLERKPSDFYRAAKLLEWLLLSSSNLFLPFIWKIAVFLFLDQRTSEDCRQHFLRMCVELRSDQERRLLIEEIMSLPDSLGWRTKKSLKNKGRAAFIANLNENEDEIDLM